MVGPDPLASLRQALAAATSPLERMKIVARAWRVIRNLSPDQRATVATQIGLEGAEEIVDRLARGKRRLSPSFLLQALEGVKAQEPEQLGKLVQDLRDPSRRKEILRDNLKRAAVRLSAEPEPPEPSFVPAAPEAYSPPEPPPAEAAPPVPVEPGPAIDPPAAEVESEAAPVPRPIVASAPAEIPTTPAVPGPPASWVAEVVEIPSVLRRLTRFREELDAGRPIEPHEIRPLLDGFPEPWARRRVLAALLERRIPSDLQLAVELIDELEPAARRWCRSVLRHRWALDEEQLPGPEKRGAANTTVSG